MLTRGIGPYENLSSNLLKVHEGMGIRHGMSQGGGRIRVVANICSFSSLIRTLFAFNRVEECQWSGTQVAWPWIIYTLTLDNRMEKNQGPLWEGWVTCLQVQYPDCLHIVPHKNTPIRPSAVVLENRLSRGWY